MTDPDNYLVRLLQTLDSAPPEQAVALLRQACDDHPHDARPLLLLGAEYAQAKELDQAEAAYTMALQRAPEFWIARFQLGLLQFTSARPAMAFVSWAPLDNLDSHHPLRIFKTALEHLARDDFGQAIRLLREGIAVNTDNLPLNHDMEMLIQRVSHLQAGQPPAAPAEPASQTTADTHFLVSTYRNVH